MKNRLTKLIVTIFLVGAIIDSTSALGYAAGFWNYTPYTLRIHFTSESCPWVLRWACGTTYDVPPFQNGTPGSMSTNNTAGTVTIGGGSSNLLTDQYGEVLYSWDVQVIEIGPQDYIAFALEGNYLKVRVRRADTGADEIEYLELKR